MMTTDQPSADHGDSLDGQVVDARYRIEAELGRGAMGIVYRARHVVIGRVVALKVIHRRLLSDAAMIVRFEREALAAAKLTHPNLVPVIDVIELPDGRHAMVLEYVQGVELVELLRGPLEQTRVVALLGKLCDGLEHAHHHGLVHRDLKPENVVVETDAYGVETPRIIDFGIATLRDPVNGEVDMHARLTDENFVLGTPMYMAPEQALGKRVDHRADLFALGIMAFEMLAGRPPFVGDGVEVAHHNVTRDLPRIAERAPSVGVDPLLEGIVRKLAARHLADRFPTARAARAALDQLERGRESLARLLGIASSRYTPTVAMKPLEGVPTFDAVDDEPSTTSPGGMLGKRGRPPSNS